MPSNDAGQPALSEGLVRRVPAVAQQLAGIRVAVIAFAETHGAPQGIQQDIALAVSGACANAVLHAYAGAPEPGPLMVEAYRSNGELVVVVGDEGRGMMPRFDSPGLGLGLAVIRRLTRSLDIREPDSTPGTRVQMSFPLIEGADDAAFRHGHPLL